MVEQLDLIAIVEDIGMFASMFAIVAPKSDTIVIAQILQQVLTLCLQNFLSPEDIRVLKEYLCTEHRHALRPTVACLRIAIILVTDIITPYIERLSLKG